MAAELPSPKRRRGFDFGVVRDDSAAAPAEAAAAPTAPADAAADPSVPADTEAPPAPAAERPKPGLIRSSVIRERANAFTESRGGPRMRLKRSFVEAFSAHVDSLLEQCLSRAVSNRRRTLMASDV